ncbi:hypothetical protein SASPL_125584 [Salvia splendens]|uniref:Pectate lyase n=1 Tax=Salvia splendens TaxID=180675 RepID=A0A8X8XE19_SALSN|nr:hypothetical protein SASPL_125584 [Salvia splendens]
MDPIRFVLVFLISLVALVTAKANNTETDDIVWRERALQARQANQQAYEPNPHIVLNHLNSHVHKAFKGYNSTRRGLVGKRHSGPCEATNPIDQCWRCDPHWEKNRKKLADCVLGFGRHTTGGKAGKIYMVTDPSDNDLVNPKPGTLRHAVIQTEPLWIIFARHMVIRLSQELIFTCNKTIDGRGAQIQITNGAGFMIQYVSNVIIHNIKIYDIKVGSGGLVRDSITHYGQRGQSDGDAVSVFGSSNIWLDHLSLSSCYDGLIDVVKGSTAVTISNCHFARHNDVLLFGASDSYSDDKIMQVTLAFNHFGKGLIQRMPRVRYGYTHIVNNDYTNWEMYAIGGSQGPTLLSQGNRFIASDNMNAKEVTKREYTTESVWKNWVWKSEGDVLQNGAFFIQSGDPHHKFVHGPEYIPPKPGQFASTLLSASAGNNMSTPSRKRLMRDFKRLQHDPPAGISGAPQDNNIMLWNAVIFGTLQLSCPDDTPWDGGTFKLTLQFTEDYPNKPPTVRFVSRMFHPNIYADGSICLDILQNQWSPIYDVAAILTSIQSLLCDPNPNSPANSEAARMFSENKREYNRRVREIVEQSWTAD